MGGVVAIPVALALGALGLYLARSTRDPNTGPTAATLDDAFSAWSFALLGLIIVGVAASVFIWLKSPISVGTATVVLGYAGAWTLDSVLFGASDLERGEHLEGGLFFAPVAVAAGVLAGAIGRVGGRWTRGRGSGPPSLV